MKPLGQHQDREIDMLIDGLAPEQMSDSLRRVQTSLVAARRSMPDQLFATRLAATLAREHPTRRRYTGTWRGVIRSGWLIASILLLLLGAGVTGLVRITVVPRGHSVGQNTFGQGGPLAGAANLALPHLRVLREEPLYGYSPRSLAIDATTGRAFVLASQGPHADAALVFDTATGRARGTTTLNASPSILGIAPSDDTHPAPVVVTSQQSRAHPGPTLRILDSHDGHVLATAAASIGVAGMAIAPASGIVYLVGTTNTSPRQGQLEARALVDGHLLGAIVLHRSDQGRSTYLPLRLDPLTGSSVPAKAGAEPSFVVVDALTRRAFVLHHDNVLNVVDISDPAHLRLVATRVVGLAPFTAAIDVATNRVFVLDVAGSVTMLDAGSGSLLRRVFLGSGPTALVVSTGTRKVFIGTQTGSVVMLDALNGDVQSTTSLADQLYVSALAVDERAHRVYAMTPSSTQYSPHFGTGNSAYRGDVVYDKGRLTALDAITGKALRYPIALGIGPRAIAVDAQTGHIFVALAGGYFTLKNDGSPLRQSPASLMMLDGQTQAESAPLPLRPAARIVMSLTGKINQPVTSMSSDVSKVYCVADLPSVPNGTILLFRFQHLPSRDDYYKLPAIADGSIKSIFIYGPLSHGTWRCQVDAAGKMAGVSPVVRVL